jgi:outer membrane protein TolC
VKELLKTSLFLGIFLFILTIPGLVFSSDETLPIKQVLSLKESIRVALKNSTFIQERKEAILQVMAEMKSNYADFWPKMSTGYSYTGLSDEPFMSFLGQKIPIGTRNTYRWDATLTQPLFTGFALKNRYELSRVGFDMARYQEDQVRKEVIFEVKRAYYQILYAQKSREVVLEAVRLLEAHCKDAEAFYRNELIPKNDLLKSQVALAHAKQDLVRAENQVNLAISDFNTILRIGIHNPTEVEDILNFKTIQTGMVEAIEIALKNRPETKVLEAVVKSKEIGINLARSAYYPEVALVGRYERMGDGPEVNGNNLTNKDIGSVFLQARWTFFEWGKTKSEIRKTESQKREMEQVLIRVKEGIMLDVKKAFLNLMESEKNIETAKESMNQAKENYRITNLQYQQQLTTSTEVLEARTLLTQSKNYYYHALYGYQEAMARLNWAIGLETEE